MQQRKLVWPRFRGSAVYLCLTLILSITILLSGCDLMGPSTAGPTPIAQVSAAATQTTAPPTDAPQPPTDTPLPAPTSTETPIPPSPTPTPRALAGKVTDLYTGAPISGAQITAGGTITATNPSGQYYFEVMPNNAVLQVEATGYASAEIDSGAQPTLDVALRPTTLRGRITDGATGKPVYGAIVRIDIPQAAGAQPSPTVEDTTPVTNTSGSRLPGLSAPSNRQTDPTATAGASISDTVAPPTDTPVPPTATPTPPPVMPTPINRPDMILGVTNVDGDYTLENVPDGVTMTVKMPGYKLEKIKLAPGTSQDVKLTPFTAKALYLTDAAAGYGPLVDPIMDMIDKTELNAVVLNMQNDSAEMVYSTTIGMAQQAGAVDMELPNIKDFIAQLHAKGIYVIGRMVTFMQPAIADAYPQLAVTSAATGKPWIGGELSQQRWLDPTNPAAQEYPLAVMKEAVTLGFDEVQLDYIRFPSDPAPGEKWDNMRFSQPADDSNKGDYIGKFLQRAHNMMNETDAFLSADIFGYTVWPDQDGTPMNAAIGQVFEKMIGNVDYISPMIYPSHFSYGEMGFDKPNDHPKEIITQASIYTMDRLAGQRAVYRPWLQGFDWDHVEYREELMRVQIDAAESHGALGWMFWDPSNVYFNGFKPAQ